MRARSDLTPPDGPSAITYLAAGVFPLVGLVLALVQFGKGRRTAAAVLCALSAVSFAGWSYGY